MSLTNEERNKVYHPIRGKGKFPPLSVRKLQMLYPDMFREVLATVSPSWQEAHRHEWEC
jgi:hypothetical protein